MITHQIEYILPESLEEARALYDQNNTVGRSVVYYSGGSEINTFTRKLKMKPDVLIDLKGIQFMESIQKKDDRILIGACINLNQLLESKIHPIFEQCVEGIADHTTRNHITFGGNLCGRLPYREAVLPLLLIPKVNGIIQTQEGSVKKPFREIFKNRMLLGKGDFLVAIEIDINYLPKKFNSIRRTKTGKIDYPLIHLAGIWNEGKVSFATSGYEAFPEVFLDIEIPQKSDLEIVTTLMDKLGSKIKSDGLGSAEYRKHLMTLALKEMLFKWGIIS